MSLTYEKPQKDWIVERAISSEKITPERMKWMFESFPPDMPLFQAQFPEYHTLQGQKNTAEMFKYWWDKGNKPGEEPVVVWYFAIDPDTKDIAAFAEWNIHYAGKKTELRDFPTTQVKDYFPSEQHARYGQHFSDVFLAWRMGQIEKHFDENVCTLDKMVTRQDRHREGAGTALMVYAMNDLVIPLNAVGLVEASPAGGILYKEFGFDWVGYTEKLELKGEFKDWPSNGMAYMYRPVGKWTMEQTIEGKKAHRKELEEQENKKAAEGK